MPVKKLRVSFEVDMELFARALAISHTDMCIQAYGTSEMEQPSQPTPLQIENRNGLRSTILKALSGPKKLRLHEIRVVIVQAGYSAKSINSAIHLMQADGLIRRAGYGVFAITKKGLNNVGA